MCWVRRGLEAVRRSSRIYLEAYTSQLLVPKEQLVISGRRLQLCIGRTLTGSRYPHWMQLLFRRAGGVSMASLSSWRIGRRLSRSLTTSWLAQMTRMCRSWWLATPLGGHYLPVAFPPVLYSGWQATQDEPCKTFSM